MKFILLSIFIFLMHCSSSKVVLICGDHKCINKKEAELYFEDNLSIEVQVIDKKKEKTIDLVLLNTKIDKDIQVEDNLSSKKEILVLSKEELKERKKAIKQRKNSKKIKREVSNKVATKSNVSKKKKKFNNQILNTKNDICKIVKKCDIDNISKHLMKKGLESSYPNIN